MEECPNCRRQSEQFASFTQIVSHDLQSPVKKIISFLDLLKNQLDQKFDPKSSEYLERINKNALTLTVLMKKLKDYSHFSLLTEEKQNVDLSKTLDSVRATLARDIETTRAQIDFPSLPTVLGRATHLTQLWSVLIQNALVHRGDQTPAIKIEVTQREREWLFSITDNGLGIQPSDTEKIFQVFPRMENQEGPATGTGLAIAKKIVENHRGRIWVESNPPQGSTFFFTLPND